VVLVASSCAAFTDVWRFKVYNALTLPLLVGGLVYHSIVGQTAGLGGSLAGMAFGFGVLIVPYMVGALGAGDVKFVMAIGAWLGLTATGAVLVIGCIATGVYAIALIVIHREYRLVWANIQLAFFRLSTIGRHFGADDQIESVQSMAKTDDRRRRLIPFSAMVSVGVVGTYVLIVWQQ